MTAEKKKATWYVSFALPDPNAAHRRYPRQTRTFANEDQARLFASSLLGQTNEISAGTINPHLPRCVIAPQAIAGWVGNG